MLVELQNHHPLPRKRYFIEETGLYYNWWRWYGNNTGRYFEIDYLNKYIISKEQENNYVYARCNSIRFIDYRGLSCTCNSLEAVFFNFYYICFLSCCYDDCDRTTSCCRSCYACLLIGIGLSASINACWSNVHPVPGGWSVGGGLYGVGGVGVSGDSKSLSATGSIGIGGGAYFGYNAMCEQISSECH